MRGPRLQRGRGPLSFGHTAGVPPTLTNEVFDLLVVGAGPGGSSAVATALRAGLAVAQLDGARFPRVKPCAGGLTPKAVHALPRELGVLVRGTFAEFEFNAWRGTRTVFGFRAPLLTMVARPELDNRLVEDNRRHARLSFLDGEPVRALEWREGRFHVRTERRELVARQLVGADGANGIVARAFPLAEARGRAAAVELVLAREALANDPVPRPCFDFGAVPRGYGWVFPKDRELSVGLYTLARGLKDVRARLFAYLGAKGFRWRSAAAEAEARASFEAHTIPLGGRLRASEVPVYLVGDAGAFADALTGEGIYHALESGRIAGELCARVARGESSSASYPAELERTVLRDTRWSWRLSGAFYRRPDLALRVLRHTLWRPLVHGTGSGATFSACLARAPRLWLAARRTRSAKRTSEIG
ncbi:MAG: geranylgeranyl reductase family protein [Planctomycetes bacterium]|nr:geranylgeranyl reductase family protein [Planctomycetota bacterium]